MSYNEKLEATEIKIEEDRILIYGHPKWGKEYHVIATTDTPVAIGEIIEYEPEGFNFGWFVKNISQSK